MARLSSAEELLEALNGLSPQAAWGDIADVGRIFQDGCTSLNHLTTVQPDLLQGYGLTAFRAVALPRLLQKVKTRVSIHMHVTATACKLSVHGM